MTEPLKIVVTNENALAKKYGDLTAVMAAVDRWIAADAKRGLRTVLVRIDNARDMRRYGAPVTSNRSRQGAKRAVDDIFARDNPAYLVLLGGPDVIPFQELKNPLRDDPHDKDPVTPSDLPYACDAPYSNETEKFLGPARVVGRLPDLRGATDPALLIELIDGASRWKSRSAAEYANAFAISAHVWQGSTKLSLRKIFGKAGRFFRSPRSGPKWKQTQIAPRVHLINCHGASADPYFYGEDVNEDQPEALYSGNIPGLISEGSVVAAECCYGGELYDVELTEGAAPICTTYLREGAYAVFASTTVSYGPADDNDWADLICQYFLKAVLHGASVGRAALEARQQFVKHASELDPMEVKTIGQFYLLGDPSVHPVGRTGKRSRAKTARIAGAAMGMVGRVAPGAVTGLATAEARRSGLRERGRELGRETAAATCDPRIETDPVAERMMREVASHYGEPAGPVVTFELSPPQRRTAKAKLRAAAGRPHEVSYCIVSLQDRESRPKTRAAKSLRASAGARRGERRGGRRGALVVAKIENGKVVGSKRAFVH